MLKEISIIIPTLNEEANIASLISRISEAMSKAKIQYELIFIDDNSIDNTIPEIKKFAKKFPISVWKKVGKAGKSYSIFQGIESAKYENIAMIDADLQYPPEEIPEMLKKLSSADLIIADRKDYHDSKTRRVMSNSFKFMFGKLLFGLNHDIQSGLKVFKKDLFNTIKFEPSSPWTFDLEFIHRAREAGYKLANHEIIFAERSNGESKVKFVKQSFEIGTNALKLKSKRIHPAAISPKNNLTMVGAGVGYKRAQYITHTTIPHSLSALKTFTRKQKALILILAVIITAGLFFNLQSTLKILIATLTTVYFADVLFNLFIITKSLRAPEEISFSDKELKEIDESELPIYTILCPLYKEAQIIPQFMKAINKLSWPKDKLDVILLLEADDKFTIETAKKMNLPKFVRTLIVPPSFPKTKPKACNYGLNFAKGEYLVIFDAEDIPEPNQLKKAYLGFKNSAKNVICLQAKLNYYNPHQNLLTRFFTAEYSLWFDITLPGLQSVDTALPLGGTSNHFKTANLREVQGWDPFNVTEDADLGIRLFKKGYKTAMIDSVTLEEANSNVKNWFRQRSRWIKGYMQTYLVHNRKNVKSTVKFQKLHSLYFQLIIGGKIAFVLINPLLWILTISYFTLYAYVGPTIEQLYPSVIFYMAITSLVLGNFLFLFYYMIGLAKRKHWNLIKFVYLVPIYWLMISISAFIALYQLIFKPHYWEKTVHGLHLAKSKQIVIPEAIVEEEEKEAGFAFPLPFRNKIAMSIANKKTYIGGAVLIGVTFIANFLNFSYNAYLGRVLDFDDFALIGLMGGLLAASSILFSAFSTTTNFRSGFLIGKYDDGAGLEFFKFIRKRGFIISLGISFLWLLSTPLLMKYFHTSSPYPFVLFGIVVLLGLVGAANRGLLYSRLMFGSIALVNIVDPIIKLGVVFFLIYFGLEDYSFSAVPLGVLGMFIMATVLVKIKTRNTKIEIKRSETKEFPAKFFFASLINGFAAVSFLSFDIILANHFLPKDAAGKYALISLVGKMVFFLGSLTSPFITPLISRDEGSGKNSNRKLNIMLLVTGVLSFVGFLAFGLLSNITIPLLYGEKSLTIISYLPLFTFGMACYTVSAVIVNYYLVKRSYIFVLANLELVGVQLYLISQYHNSLQQFTTIMAGLWITNLVIALTMHLLYRYIFIFENNFRNFKELILPLNLSKTSGLNILIFNWRDTEHEWAGGAEVYIHEISKRLVKEKNNIVLFCGNDGTRSDNEAIDGVRIYRRGGFYTVYFWAFIYYVIKFRGKFDVIIDSENGIPFFTPLFARVPKVLLIHHVHQEVFRKSLSLPLATFASFLEAKLMPLVYRNVQVVTVSPSSKKEILKHHLTKKDPEIIYNGVDNKLYKPAKKNAEPMVLYLGRIKYYKSLNVFLVAAKKIIHVFPQAKLVIAGEGEEKKRLVKFAKELDIYKNIQFLGKVNEKKKIELLQKAWVFVNPSLMEGWGITTIEANACGTPTIASNVPGLSDSIKNNETGILVPYKKYNDFSKEIINLIKDTKKRNELSKNAVYWASNFSWDLSAVKLNLLLKNEIEKDNYKKMKKFRFRISNITSLF